MYTPNFAQELLRWKNEMNIPGQSFNDSVFNLLINRPGQGSSLWNNDMFRASPGNLGQDTLFKDPLNGSGSVSPGMRDFLGGGGDPNRGQFDSAGSQGLSPYSF